MKLYSAAYAISPWKVLVVIKEKGISDIDVINLDLGKLEHKTDEYKSLAPNAKVPSLELDDGTIVLETTAISR